MATSEPSQRRSGADPAAVLVVDDDPQVREMIRFALEGEGLTVETAADRRGALERAARRRLGLLILDITLPGDGSTEIAGAVRAEQHGAVPVLVVTADGHAREKAERVGAYAYLVKPFEIDDLVAAVRRGLAGH